ESHHGAGSHARRAETDRPGCGNTRAGRTAGSARTGRIAPAGADRRRRMSVLDLVRPDLRAFAGYTSARKTGVSGNIWLNANESPWPNPGDAGARCNRYPEPQPAPLRQALAALYGVDPAHLLIGRGSDEAIDLLVRVLCRPQTD